MDGSEAVRIARACIFRRHELETVQSNGVGLAVPTKRKPGGQAVNAEDQDAADAYNWLAAHHAAIGAL